MNTNSITAEQAITCYSQRAEAMSKARSERYAFALNTDPEAVKEYERAIEERRVRS